MLGSKPSTIDREISAAINFTPACPYSWHNGVKLASADP